MTRKFSFRRTIISYLPPHPPTPNPFQFFPILFLYLSIADVTFTKIKISSSFPFKSFNMSTMVFLKYNQPNSTSNRYSSVSSSMSHCQSVLTLQNTTNPKSHNLIFIPNFKDYNDGDVLIFSASKKTCLELLLELKIKFFFSFEEFVVKFLKPTMFFGC